MSIITISRGSLSGGQELAERVAGRLGYRCVSREVLLEAAKRYGVPEPKLSELFEKKPSFWEWLTRSRERYIVFVQAAMCELAQEGQLVYHGHAGQQLLAGVGHVLKVRLIAPLERRIRGAMEREKLDREAATKYVERIDDERYHRMRELFEVDWRDPALYDVVLNVERMSLGTAAEIVISLAQQPEFQPTAESTRALQDLTVGARVKATLLADPATNDIPLQVEASEGVVRISGIVTAIDDGQIEDTLRDKAMTVPGVRSVILDVQFRPVLAHPG
ncbi:MAG TPA: cytidylate kinase family protein [Chloroflexota bacterium]|nr:cytidylate kinase family protein [Chloroflexota bacterium]